MNERSSPSAEIAALAARWIVEDGLEWGPAKQRAAQQLGLSGRRTSWPDNDELEDAVREHIAIFAADTQPAELRALREVALKWMLRLSDFRPHLTGAVWRGTATRHSPVHVELYCDDAKSAEIGLLNRGLDFDVSETAGPRGEPVDMLLLADRVEIDGERLPVTVCLTILDLDDVRGRLKPTAGGRGAPRGDVESLRQRILSDDAQSESNDTE